MKTPNIEEIRQNFMMDRFATENGAYIEEVSNGYAKCSLKIESRHLNSINSVMGGAIFTLADFAFAVATNHTSVNCVSLSCQITYLSPTKGDTLIAEATLIKDGHSTCYYQVLVSDNLGKNVAHVTVNGFHI